MIRPTINRFNWKVLWYWVKLPTLILALMLAGWVIYGCAAQYPFMPVPVDSESQLLIDQEVEKVRTSNEAYRKLRAAGCEREDLKLKRPYAVAGESFYEYECRLSSGVMVKLIKINDQWIIVPE